MQSHKNHYIERYYEVIGFNSANAAITLETVNTILIKHGLTFAATTLPANLNDNVSLDFSNLASYLLDNRYGYCFHNNIVAFESLKYLGFSVELLAAYMRTEPDYSKTLSLATHVCILLMLNDKKYLLDPGWGCAQLKPLALDEIETSDTGYRVSRLPSNRYALVEKRSKEKIRYEFECKPVRLKDFELALKYVMSKQHDFYNMFFFQQKLPCGDIHYIVNRTYTYLDAKGNKKSASFNHPAKDILQSKFKLNPIQQTRITQSSYPNPAIRKIVVEFNLPKKIYQNIYCFLSKDSKNEARQISKFWKQSFKINN